MNDEEELNDVVRRERERERDVSDKGKYDDGRWLEMK